MNNGLPNDFTACETYRGCIIAVRGDYYRAFKNGYRTGYVAKTRADLRRILDETFPLSL